MKKRVHIYLAERYVSTVLSLVLYIGIYASLFLVEPFARERLVWFCLTSGLYLVTAIATRDEMFYKTSFPLWALGLLLALDIHALAAGSALFWIVCGCVMLFCGGYTFLVSGGAKPGWLFALYLPAMAGIWLLGNYFGRSPLLWELALGMQLVLVPGLHCRSDEGFHPTWGDRMDGRRIRSAPAMELITPYFMVNRCGASNLFEEAVEITELERYVRRKRKEGMTTFGIMHVIMAAYARTIAKYPALNRFIAGQKLYTHGEDITLCITVKKEMNLSSPDTVVKVHLNPQDSAQDVYAKFSAELEKAKDSMQSSGTDNTAGAFVMIPGLILKASVWLLKTMDYFGLLPGVLMEVSPFHGSVYFTAIGSLGIRPVYHHLYDFGVIPVFCAFGRKRHAQELVDGAVVNRKYVDLKFTLDERICDGYYYASAIKYFLRVLAHPDVLDTAPETVNRDIP